MPTFNLRSRTFITAPCDLDDLDVWLVHELDAINDTAVRSIVDTVCKNLPQFVKFPLRAVLLWHGCDRIAPKGKRQKYHRYTDCIRARAKTLDISLDTRPNGPAIASFKIAGGERPDRVGSSNSWSIHHLYSGKFPYYGEPKTLHAQKEGLHFTQSAGLIAVHPIADAICDEFPFIAWYLRAKAFQQFGYDPDLVFAKSHDPFGFAPPFRCEVLDDGT